VACTVLERREGESNLTRAFAVHARTLELLDARGVADELVGTGMKVDGVRLFGKAAIDLTELPSRFPFLLLYEALRHGRFVLLVPAGEATVTLDGWAGRVEAATRADGSPTLALVRPDGYVAWACDEADPERRAAATQAALADAGGAPAAAALR
jgi:FAD binding domain